MRVNVGYHTPTNGVSIAVERNGISAYCMMTRAYEYFYGKSGLLGKRLGGIRYSLTIPRICDEDIRTTGGE